jgi:exodeoxyribonuclease V gamma subunit
MGPIQTFSNRDLPGLYQSYSDFVRTNHLSALESETVIVPSYWVASHLKNKVAQINGIFSATECFLPKTFLGRLFRKLNSQDLHPMGNAQISWLLFNAALNSVESHFFSPIRHLIPPEGTESQLFNLCTHLAPLLSETELYRAHELAEILGKSPGHFMEYFWQEEIRFRKAHGYFGVFEQWEYFTNQGTHDAIEANNARLPCKRLLLFGFKHLPPTFVEIMKSLARTVPVVSFELDPFPVFAKEPKAKLQNGASTTLLGNLRRLIGTQPNSKSTLVHKPIISSSDTTLQIHLASSVQREIEILKNTILHELSLNEDWCPQDITVVVPDIEMYEPFIRAIFGPASEHPLPFTISPQKNKDVEQFRRFIERTLLLGEESVRVSHLSDFLDFLPFSRWCAIPDNDRAEMPPKNILFGKQPIPLLPFSIMKYQGLYWDMLLSPKIPDPSKTRFHLIFMNQS